MMCRRRLLAQTAAEHEAVRHPDQEPGEFRGVCMAGERAVRDEDGCADADPLDGRERKSQLRRSTFFRISLRVAQKAVEHLPGHCCEQKAVEAEDGGRGADTYRQ